MDEKLAVAHIQSLQSLFIPIMVVANDEQTDPNSQKTYFILEKINIDDLATGESVPAITLCDSGSGKTVANNVEHLDTFSEVKTINIVLST